MLNEEKVDMILKSALSPVTPDERMNQRLKQELEGKKMKKFNMKKVVICVAACCLLMGTVSIASSGIISYTTVHSWAFDERDFLKLEKLEKKAGFSVKAVEQFQNGYQFSDMSIDHNADHDENGNVIGQYKGIDFSYKKQGEDMLYMNTQLAETAYEEMEREPDVVQVIENIEVKYYLDTYKWVPGDYELTDEDKKNMEKDNYFISMGASEVSENQVSGVSWIQDGIYYHIGNVYGKTEPDILFQMAEELIMAE